MAVCMDAWFLSEVRLKLIHISTFNFIFHIHMMMSNKEQYKSKTRTETLSKPRKLSTRYFTISLNKYQRGRTVDSSEPSSALHKQRIKSTVHHISHRNLPGRIPISFHQWFPPSHKQTSILVLTLSLKFTRKYRKPKVQDFACAPIEVIIPFWQMVRIKTMTR